MDMIRLQNVNKTYNNVPILKDINLSVKKGEIFGLLGPSGVGKSTIIKIMTGLCLADTGSIQVMGENIVNGRGSNTSRIGIVTDTFGFMERLTSYENLLLYCRIYNINALIIDSLLEDLNLIEAKNKKVSELSKGMRQRLHLARAIMHAPEILILDEPTSDIDPKTQQKVHDLIKKIKEEGVTILITTHDMQEATELCDHIAIMKAGRIAEYGTPDYIFEKYNLESKIFIKFVDGTEISLINGPELANEIKKQLKISSLKILVCVSQI